MEARTTDWVPARETGQKVHADPNVGFWCLNEEQGPGQNCSNYAVRFLCPKGLVLNPEPFPKTPDDPILINFFPLEQTTAPTFRDPGPRGQSGARVPRSAVRWGSEPAPEPAGPAPQPALDPGWREKSAVDQSVPGEVRQTRSVGPLGWEELTASLSPDCSLLCEMGKANAECDACVCEDHTLLGSVRGAGGLTAEGTAVLRSGKLLAVTDHNGHFRIPGICPDGNATLAFILKGHSSLTANVPRSRERVSVLSVQLKRTGTRPGSTTTTQNDSSDPRLRFSEKLHVLTNPEGKVRREGQTAAFCCKVAGTPQPEEYQWYVISDPNESSGG